MSITQTSNFGTTEQITNIKLHNLVNNATLSIQSTEFANNVLWSLPSSAGYVSGQRIANLNSLVSTSGFIPSWNIVPSLASGATIKFNGTNGFYGV